MKKRKALVVFIAIVMVFCHNPFTALATDAGSVFLDMPEEGHWSTEALKVAVNNGLINGFEEKNGKYIKPNNTITRAQIAAIVNRAFGANDTAPLTGNTDISASSWYYKDIQKAVKMGTMKLDANMRPNDNITRQEAFTILARALKMDGGSKNDFAKFSDASHVADWAESAMGAMVRAGYVKGDNNLLNPKANMTRAQFAVVLNNAIFKGKLIDIKPITTNFEFDLTTEKGIREYLQGEWVYDYYYRGDVICKMNIDKDLNVHLSFKNSYSDEPKGDYSGKIKLDRIYANKDQAPDLLSIELKDKGNPGGDFLFLHRTIYDGKRVMSWFFAGNGNSIFDVADFTGDFKNTAEEIIFEKITGEKSQLQPRKNDDFYAFYWGKGDNGKSIWLDDVWWTPNDEDDFSTAYPIVMTNYNNDMHESVIYSIAPNEIMDILGEDLTEGIVYYVQTDEQGKIKHFISADEKKWIDEGYITPEIRAMVMDSLKIYDEINEYLKMGMDVEFDGESIMLNNEEYYKVALGTKHEDNFVRELFYAVNTYTGEVYWYDVLNDVWKPMAKG